MTLLDYIIGALGCTVIIRSLLLLVFAETGRKHDLIKHIYKSGTDFQIAILIPFIDETKSDALQDLIRALSKQDYPASRIGIHIAATEDSADALPASDDLPKNVTVWTNPEKKASRGQTVSWLVERLLAAGGSSKLFVFLDADDIVRPDFLRNVTTRAFDCFAMQGYIALKRPPKGLFPYVSALSTRLVNRIENAGRFHMGLSCKLLNSGWVVRQEILEMLPFRQEDDLDNLEYTTLLNLNGYRVNWAPNVVVYKDERVNVMTMMKDIVQGAVNRVRLAIQYTVPLLVNAVTKMDATFIEQAWSQIKPPNFVIGLLMLLGAFAASQQQPSPPAFYLWFLMAIGFWSTQVLALAVARCSFKDVLYSQLFTPATYAVGLFTFPAFLVLSLAQRIKQQMVRPKGSRIGKRFDESRVPAAVASKSKRLTKTHRLLDTYIDEAEELEAAQATTEPLETVNKRNGSKPTPRDFDALYRKKIESYETMDVPETAEDAQTLRETHRIPITNGKNTVDCLLHTYKAVDADGHESYHLVFEYKNLSFKTQPYRILDQAYYELLTKLRKKGFNIVSCGSCAFFYRPTAGNHYGVAKDIGFCLFGKRGEEIDIDADAITVVSQACGHHTDMAEREAVHKEWQDSLSRIALG